MKVWEVGHPLPGQQLLHQISSFNGATQVLQMSLCVKIQCGPIIESWSPMDSLGQVLLASLSHLYHAKRVWANACYFWWIQRITANSKGCAAVPSKASKSFCRMPRSLISCIQITPNHQRVGYPFNPINSSRASDEISDGMERGGEKRQGCYKLNQSVPWR